MSANPSGSENPYAPPKPASSPESRSAPCPKCGSIRNRAPSFTWWGGVIGPKLLSHVKCLDCGAGYNSKTGRSNTAANIAYQIVGLALGLALGWWVLSMRH